MNFEQKNEQTPEGAQELKKASIEDIREELKRRGIELYSSDSESIEKVEKLILGQFDVSPKDLTDKLEMADFAEGEIEDFLKATKDKKVLEFLSNKIKEEQEYLSKKLNNPEFIEGVDKSIGSLKKFADSIGLTQVLEERWPKVMYAGKIGRMIIRSHKMNVLDTYGSAAGEYMHEDKTSYMFDRLNEDQSVGKSLLETQIHETIHGISKNEISSTDRLEINKSGFYELQFDSENPLESKYEMRGLNEGITEYFARKFCKDSFAPEPRTEHEYDPFVKNLKSLIDGLGVNTGKNREEIEKELFTAYVHGDKESFIEDAKKVLGKFAKQVLHGFFNTTADFVQAYALKKLGGISKEKVTLDYEDLQKTGVDIEEFRKEYPFVRLIKYDFDPQTFEPIEVEV